MPRIDNSLQPWFDGAMAKAAPPTSRSRTALVLSGGGARGAYQAGVLRGLVDIGVLSSTPGFEIIVGSSAGSLNAGVMAAYAESSEAGVEHLVDIWSNVEAQHVFRTDMRSLGGIGARWAWDLSFGGALRRSQPKALLDTAPLRELLGRIPLSRIAANVNAGALHALAIMATDLYTSNGYVFLQGHPDIPLWERSRWQVKRARISVDHLMASSAIPVFFPSVAIQGRHFGDGCIRNTAPLSPAINLGAQRVVAVGVQGPGTPEAQKSRKLPPPTVAQIAGVLLDAVMLDAIEVDVEHSNRVNQSIVKCRSTDPANPFRPVDVLWLRPSQHIGGIAAELSDRVPRIVHYLMRGLGTEESITELLSYLLFDPVFCGRLIELGSADVKAAKTEVRRFFAAQ
jgi:NTE family protein